MPQPIGKTAPHDTGASNQVRTSSLGSCLTIHVEGRFDFNCHQQFRRAYEGAAAGSYTEYVVDLRGTEYIDSAALGMLLVLRESAGSATRAHHQQPPDGAQDSPDRQLQHAVLDRLMLRGLKSRRAAARRHSATPCWSSTTSG